MSTLVCDRHGTTIRGRLLGLYPALVQDGVRYSAYKRLCWDCMHQTLVDHKKDWKDAAMLNGDEDAHACHSCGEVQDSIGKLSRFYVTAYPDSKQRRDYEAYYCPECADLTKSEFDLRVRS